MMKFTCGRRWGSTNLIGKEKTGSAGLSCGGEVGGEASGRKTRLISDDFLWGAEQRRSPVDHTAMQLDLSSSTEYL